MQENKQDAQRTDVLYQEEIKVEIVADAQGSTIRELVVYQLVRYEPTNQDTSQEAHDRQEDLSSYKVEDIKQWLLKKM